MLNEPQRVLRRVQGNQMACCAPCVCVCPQTEGSRHKNYCTHTHMHTRNKCQNDFIPLATQKHTHGSGKRTTGNEQWARINNAINGRVSWNRLFLFSHFCFSDFHRIIWASFALFVRMCVCFSIYNIYWFIYGTHCALIMRALTTLSRSYCGPLLLCCLIKINIFISMVKRCDALLPCKKIGNEVS